MSVGSRAGGAPEACCVAMTLMHTVTILVCLSAGFSYLNHRYIKFASHDRSDGLLALAMSPCCCLGKLGYGIESQARSFVQHIDFRRSALHGMRSVWDVAAEGFAGRGISPTDPIAGGNSP